MDELRGRNPSRGKGHPTVSPRCPRRSRTRFASLEMDRSCGIGRSLGSEPPLTLLPPALRQRDRV